MLSLSDLFANYSHEAFRLELIQQYSVPGEWENFLHFRETNIAKQHESLIKYIQTGREKILTGKRHIRARVITEPITDYVIFETKIGYIPQSQNGFEINILEQPEFDSLLSSQKIDKKLITDFWLFDKSTVAIMEYDEEGKYLANKIIDDPKIVDLYLTIRNEVIKIAHPLSYAIDKWNIKP